MKKLLLATLALAVIALAPAKQIELTEGKEIHQKWRVGNP